jgi:hypothetical protein
LAILSSVSVAIQPAAAQNVTGDPLISLTVHNEPLGEVLADITRATGYRFNLNREWQDYPVSATIDNLTLEQGLKRLLRSLNHTIIWEADKRVTIMVFGKVDPLRKNSGISFAAPPRSELETTGPSSETDGVSAAEIDPVDDAMADE